MKYLGTITDDKDLTTKEYVDNADDLLNNAVTQLNINEAKLSTALSGKAPTSHAVNASTYGLGTTDVYGHVKTVNNVTTSAHASGLALSAYQGKVLKDAIDTINTKTSSTLTVASGWSAPSTNNWCHKRAGVVDFFIELTPNAWTTGGMVTCATLPSGYRPANNLVGSYAYANSAHTFGVRVGTDGSVKIDIDPNVGKPSKIYIHCSFLT